MWEGVGQVPVKVPWTMNLMVLRSSVVAQMNACDSTVIAHGEVEKRQSISSK